MPHNLVSMFSRSFESAKIFGSNWYICSKVVNKYEDLCATESHNYVGEKNQRVPQNHLIELVETLSMKFWSQTATSFLYSGYKSKSQFINIFKNNWVRKGND